MRVVSLLFILLIGLATNNATAEIQDKKAKVIAALSNTSDPVDVFELQTVRPKMTHDDVDVVLFRLRKEIEKVPEFNFGIENSYDMRLIYNLFQIVYARADKDYLDAVLKLKNQSDLKLSAFPFYSEYISYQLDSVILRSNIDLTDDRKVLERRTGHLESITNYLNSYKSNELSRITMEKAPTHVFSYMANCQSIFH